MNLAQATGIANRILCRLGPYCVRAEAAGSVRRRKADVGDIEICSIPRPHATTDLFGPCTAGRSPDFVRIVHDLGEILKGDPLSGRYIQIQLPDGIALDLFLATADNWGLILAIRTGSATYSHEVLAKGWVRAGYHCDGGMLRDHTGAEIPCRDELDLFARSGVCLVPPEEREM